MAFVDTHCHVDLYPDYVNLLRETESAEVYTIAVTNTPSVFRRCLSLTKDTKFIWAALGLHPQLVAQRHHELDLMFDMFDETRYVGEIGLDFSTTQQADRSLQERVFTAILNRCVRSPNKVLTVHSRRAAGRVIDLIGNSFPCVVIMHWFSGSQKELQKAISAGFYFSANSAMIGSEKGRKLLEKVPLDRLLTESDGPFVKLNGRPARPQDIEQTVLGLAELFGVTVDSVAKNIQANFTRILSK